MNCIQGSCLHESLGQRLSRIASQCLHGIVSGIVNVAIRRQRYREIRTRSVHLALAQRAHGTKLLAQDPLEKPPVDTRNA